MNEFQKELVVFKQNNQDSALAIRVNFDLNNERLKLVDDNKQQTEEQAWLIGQTKAEEKDKFNDQKIENKFAETTKYYGLADTIQLREHFRSSGYTFSKADIEKIERYVFENLSKQLPALNSEQKLQIFQAALFKEHKTFIEDQILKLFAPIGTITTQDGRIYKYLGSVAGKYRFHSVDGDEFDLNLKEQKLAPVNPFLFRRLLNDGREITRNKDQSNLKPGEARYQDKLGINYILTEKAYRIEFPKWLSDKTPANRNPKLDPELEKKYLSFRKEYDLPDTKFLREKFIAGDKAIKNGEAKTIFTTEEINLVRYYSDGLKEVERSRNEQQQRNQNTQNKQQAKIPQQQEQPSGYEFERTGKIATSVKYENGTEKQITLKYDKNNQQGLESGQYRFTDEIGNKYIINPKTGELINESADTALLEIPVQLPRLGSVTEAFARSNYINTVAVTISSNYIDIPKEDIVAWLKGGIFDAKTGRAFSSDRFFARLGVSADATEVRLFQQNETQTVKFILSESDLNYLRVYSKERRQLIQKYEDAKQNYIKQGQDDYVADLNAQVDLGWASREAADKEIAAYTKLYNDYYETYSRNYRQAMFNGKNMEIPEKEIARLSKAQTLSDLKDIADKYGTFGAKVEEDQRIANLTYGDLAREFPSQVVRTVTGGIGQILRTAGAISYLSPVSFENSLNYLFRGETLQQPADSFFYQMGDAYIWAGEKMPSNPDARKSWIMKSTDTVVQIGVQAGLAYATGGVSAGAVWGLSQGAGNAIEEARLAGATPRQQLVVGAIGAAAAVPDIFLQKMWFKQFSAAEKTTWINSYLQKIYQKWLPLVGEKDAELIARTGVRGLLSKLTTMGEKLSFNLDNQVLMPMTIERASLVLGKSVVYEGIQETTENKINQVAQKFTYNPKINWADIVKMRDQDWDAFIYGGVGGAFGGGIQVSSEVYQERSTRIALLNDALNEDNLSKRKEGGYSFNLAGREFAITEELAPIVEEYNQLEKQIIKDGEALRQLSIRAQKAKTEVEKQRIVREATLINERVKGAAANREVISSQILEKSGAGKVVNEINGIVLRNQLALDFRVVNPSITSNQQGMMAPTAIPTSTKETGLVKVNTSEKLTISVSKSENNSLAVNISGINNAIVIEPITTVGIVGAKGYLQVAKYKINVGNEFKVYSISGGSSNWTGVQNGSVLVAGSSTRLGIRKPGTNEIIPLDIDLPYIDNYRPTPNTPALPNGPGDYSSYTATPISKEFVPATNVLINDARNGLSYKWNESGNVTIYFGQAQTPFYSGATLQTPSLFQFVPNGSTLNFRVGQQVGTVTTDNVNINGIQYRLSVGQRVTVGREGDIKTDLYDKSVSRIQLTIEKNNDGIRIYSGVPRQTSDRNSPIDYPNVAAILPNAGNIVPLVNGGTYPAGTKVILYKNNIADPNASQVEFVNPTQVKNIGVYKVQGMSFGEIFAEANQLLNNPSTPYSSVSLSFFKSRELRIFGIDINAPTLVALNLNGVIKEIPGISEISNIIVVDNLGNLVNENGTLGEPIKGMVDENGTVYISRTVFSNPQQLQSTISRSIEKLRIIKSASNVAMPSVSQGYTEVFVGVGQDRGQIVPGDPATQPFGKFVRQFTRQDGSTYISERTVIAGGYNRLYEVKIKGAIRTSAWDSRPQVVWEGTQIEAESRSFTQIISKRYRNSSSIDAVDLLKQAQLFTRNRFQDPTTIPGIRDLDEKERDSFPDRQYFYRTNAQRQSQGFTPFNKPSDIIGNVDAFYDYNTGKWDGVCDHQALFLAYMLQDQRDQGRLPLGTKIFVSANQTDLGGHAFVRVEFPGGQTWIIDPRNNQFGKIEDMIVGYKNGTVGWMYFSPTDVERRGIIF